MSQILGFIGAFCNWDSHGFKIFSFIFTKTNAYYQRKYFLNHTFGQRLIFYVFLKEFKVRIMIFFNYNKIELMKS